MCISPQRRHRRLSSDPGEDVRWSESRAKMERLQRKVLLADWLCGLKAREKVKVRHGQGVVCPNNRLL